MARWDAGAANTWNRHLSALTSFTAYCRRQESLTTDPGRRLERRKVTPTRGKAIPRARLERLFTDDRNPLRERVLWRMLYETCARAEEVLGLDVPGLDTEFRRALRPAPSPAAGRPHRRAGVPGRPARSRRRTPRAGPGRHLPGDRPGPAVLPARRVPVQAGIPVSRPARCRVHPPPATPFRDDPSRWTRSRASGRRAAIRVAAGRHDGPGDAPPRTAARKAIGVVPVR
ncbi:hypothetical protein JCM9534A_02570 [Catenuloplanes indicus JCM 9534]